MADTGTTFAQVQQGSLTFSGSTGFGGFVFDRASYSVSEALNDVSGHAVANESATGRRIKRLLHGVRTEEFVLGGFVGRAAPQNVYATSQNSTITISNGKDHGDTSVTFSIRLTDWTLRKTWPLIDVTGSSSGEEKEWIWGIPVLRMQAKGWATGITGPTTEMQTAATVTFTPNDMGTILFSAASTPDGILKMHSHQSLSNLALGGGCAATVSALFEGPLQYTPGSNDFSWLLIDADNLGAPSTVEDDPVKPTVALDTDSETISKQALCYDVSFAWSAGNGGPVRSQVRLRVDKPNS